MQQEYPSAPIEYAPPLPPRRRSGVGIASFCIEVAGVATFVAILQWAIVGRSASDMTAYKLLGLTFILPAAGTALGVASMFQRRRYRGLPIAGLTINVLLGLFVLLIMVPSLVQALSR